MMKTRSLSLLASLVAASLMLGGCGDNQFEQEVKLEQSAVQLANETAQGHYRLMTVAELKGRMDKGEEMVILDTMPLEASYKKGHIPGAKNFVFVKEAKGSPVWSDIVEGEGSEAQLLALLGEDKERPLVIYCGFVQCGRSHNAAAWAVQQGYRQVYRVPGGIFAWKGAGYPLASD
ncbi:rhodanese-like domain-containing protein [Aeromonas schubertii]|uniref:Rhodanese-like domain-containing protein n=2 Tax=Aeromonas schubertii TaxID=652 RepID=A0ABS7VEU2_9GAMM|nr:rhodanese-like domain-containing protein [Aeromonas schubertii]KUE80085.1 sulfurtransferase [Aeromonas schubertii]MBZ6067902.1 rhodanese-like domain-containing protein [Aeromonas schubertii]MBZ6074068.1 rhodanese-like domain-containing protein [Aeromonas schubertii]